MATSLSADVKYKLNNRFGSGTAKREGLGDLIDDALSAAPGDLALTSAHVLVGNASNVAADVALSGDIAITNAGVSSIGASKVLTANILNANVTLAKLAAGITPSHVVKFGGKYTTLGGNATEAQTVSGVLSTDIVHAVLQAKGGTPRTILTSAPTTDTITYVFSGDPSTDHVVAYVVWRAAS